MLIDIVMIVVVIVVVVIIVKVIMVPCGGCSTTVLYVNSTGGSNRVMCL